MEDSSSLISIIIPVFNAEQYLTQCLESVLNQTYKRLEVICVNDGSCDNSIEILNQFQNKDDRIIIIDKMNEGVSAARNIALQKAQGNYVMFIDADDWIDSDTCETALFEMKRTNSDVVMWSYTSEHETNQVPKMIFPEDTVFERKAVRKKIHRRLIGIYGEELAHPELADSLCTVWGKLYKKELILKNNISFIDLKKIGTYEDGIFNLEVFYYVNKAAYINKCFYHYRRENNSSVTSGYRQSLFSQWQNLFRIMYEYIDEKKLPDIYTIALNNRIAMSILGLGLNELGHDCSARKKIKTIRKMLSIEYYREAYKKLDMRYFPIHWKIFYCFAKQRNAVGVYALLNIIKRIISR
jgi:glycosyltransferase involved in cell wall biosynthesis